jgi:Domain of unknown function (DUF4189)
MRFACLFVVCALGLALLLFAAPVQAAEYGAVAHDASSGKAGLSSHHRSLRAAERAALRECGAAGCRVVLKFGPRSCAALATARSGKAWGAARRKTAEAARAGALGDCRKHGGGECVVRISGCNE